MQVRQQTRMKSNFALEEFHSAAREERDHLQNANSPQDAFYLMQTNINATSVRGDILALWNTLFTFPFFLGWQPSMRGVFSWQERSVCYRIWGLQREWGLAWPKCWCLPVSYLLQSANFLSPQRHRGCWHPVAFGCWRCDREYLLDFAHPQ